LLGLGASIAGAFALLLLRARIPEPPCGGSALHGGEKAKLDQFTFDFTR
jgi:hypothetical protein